MIQSKKNGRYCVGLSNDVIHRLKEHNQSMSHWRKSGVPFEPVNYETYRPLEDAREGEKKLKHFEKGYVELKKRLHHSMETRPKVGGK